jgi:site-specific recombinase XerD
MSVETAAQLKSGSRVSIDVLISRYELSNRAEGKSPKTVQWYSDILWLFVAYLKGEGYPDDISSLNMEVARGYVIYLRNKRKFQGHPFTPEQSQLLSLRTVQCHVRALKAFSSWLYHEGYTQENRLKDLKLPKAPLKIIEPLTPEKIKAVIANISRDSATGMRNHAIFVTLLDTGLRASEIASVTLGQLNLDAGYIKVMGKGVKERIVPIGRFVKMTLWQYIDRARPASAAGICDSLFLSASGKPITVNTIKLLFSRLARTSGVQRLHAHLCRHTFAVNYLLNGGDIYSLQQILGHASLDMVRHYLHFTSAQITAQHHKYSPMDKLQKETESHKLLSLSGTE